MCKWNKSCNRERFLCLFPRESAVGAHKTIWDTQLTVLVQVVLVIWSNLWSHEMFWDSPLVFDGIMAVELLLCCLGQSDGRRFAMSEFGIKFTSM